MGKLSRALGPVLAVAVLGGIFIAFPYGKSPSLSPQDTCAAAGYDYSLPGDRCGYESRVSLGSRYISAGNQLKEGRERIAKWEEEIREARAASNQSDSLIAR